MTKKGVQYDKKVNTRQVSMTNLSLYTLSFAQHNNAFSKKPKLSLIAKQTAFTRHRKPFKRQSKARKSTNN